MDFAVRNINTAYRNSYNRAVVKTDSQPLLSSASGAKNPNQMSEGEKKMLNELKRRDAEVRAHEMAHLAAGAGLVTGGASYTYQIGPDGQRYAIGGEVQIDVSPVPGDPEATIRKMQQVRRAALAPADPSPQDRAVAAMASQIEAQARIEASQMAQQKREEQMQGTTSTEGENTQTSTISEGQNPFTTLINQIYTSQSQMSGLFINAMG